MNRNLRGSLTLLLTAIIWGAAFVAQSSGMDYVGPFTYNTLRSLLAFIVLLPVLCFFSRKKTVSLPDAGTESAPSADSREVIVMSIKGGLASGFFLAVATGFQQSGLCYTSAGKAGFITAIYIVIVPIIGIFMGRRPSIVIVISVLTAIVGFYLLCIRENFSIAFGDLLVLGCAIVFSLQIVTVDFFLGKNINPLLMSMVQFLTVMVISAVPMLIFETVDLSMIWKAKWTIAYAGVLSSGAGYTLQIFGQRDCEPALATLIMSLESVFSVLFGWLLLHESLSLRELSGCALVFAAVLLAQLAPGKK